MKSIEDIKIFIEERLDDIVERPKSYTSCPTAAEDVLLELERVLSFVNSSSAEIMPAVTMHYAQFHDHANLDSATFTDRYLENHPDCSTDELFHALSEFWSGYLTWRRGLSVPDGYSG